MNIRTTAAAFAAIALTTASTTAQDTWLWDGSTSPNAITNTAGWRLNVTYQVVGANTNLTVTGNNDADLSSPTWLDLAGTIEGGRRITSIGARAFTNCTNLAGVNISATVQTIGNYVFTKPHGCD
jgi:Ni/Fe-hydrogenase subunit HybB-like protein